MDTPSAMPSASPSSPPSSRRVWISLIVFIVVVSLLLVAWQKGLLTRVEPKTLTPEEVAAIEAFLKRENLPVPTAEEVEAIKNYLNEAPVEMSSEERQQVLEYLNNQY